MVKGTIKERWGRSWRHGESQRAHKRGEVPPGVQTRTKCAKSVVPRPVVSYK
jgi:hypothetical protein